MKSHLHFSQTVSEKCYKMLANEKSFSFLPGLSSVLGNLIFMNKDLEKSSIKSRKLSSFIEVQWWYTLFFLVGDIRDTLYEVFRKSKRKKIGNPYILKG